MHQQLHVRCAIMQNHFPQENKRQEAAHEILHLCPPASLLAYPQDTPPGAAAAAAGCLVLLLLLLPARQAGLATPQVAEQGAWLAGLQQEPSCQAPAGTRYQRCFSTK
jgi:hypothetical protein